MSSKNNVESLVRLVTFMTREKRKAFQLKVMQEERDKGKRLTMSDKVNQLIDKYMG